MITLTIAPKKNRNQNSYRLKVNPRDNHGDIYFVHDDVVCMVYLNGSIELKYRHTDKCKYELDSTQGHLNNWILNNNFHLYPNQHPTKLNFELIRGNGVCKIIFIERVLNKQL
jgi:hypothetical protein